VQIIVGATMRHTGAGLAIPDFPLAFRPPDSAAVGREDRDPLRASRGRAARDGLRRATTAHVFYHHRRRGELVRPALLLLVLLATQITLGAFTVLTRKDVLINSLHVVTGGCVLATTVVLALRAHRARFAGAMEAGSHVVHGGSKSKTRPTTDRFRAYVERGL
jgi:cytochrome c oxidase assembly protein subunit 15